MSATYQTLLRRTHAQKQHRSDGGAALLSLLGTEDQDNDEAESEDEAGLFLVRADGTAVTAQFGINMPI